MKLKKAELDLMLKAGKNGDSVSKEKRKALMKTISTLMKSLKAQQKAAEANQTALLALVEEKKEEKKVDEVGVGVEKEDYSDVSDDEGGDVTEKKKRMLQRKRMRRRRHRRKRKRRTMMMIQKKKVIATLGMVISCCNFLFNTYLTAF